MSLVQHKHHVDNVDPRFDARESSSAHKIDYNTPHVIGFVLGEGFSMSNVATAMDTLRLANQVAGQNLYDWYVFAIDIQPITASNGCVILPSSRINEPQRLDAIFVCSSWEHSREFGITVAPWLRRLERNGVKIGALGDGVHALAKFTFLDGYCCAAHGHQYTYFNEVYPQISLSAEIFEIDRSRITCGGGVAVIDLFLHLISVDHGCRLSEEVASLLQLEQVRKQGEAPRIRSALEIRFRHHKILKVLEKIENNIDQPVSRAMLAKYAGLSVRQLERLFAKCVGRSPAEYYRGRRLYHARMLIRRSYLTITEIAMACGFESPSHFSKSYRAEFGQKPSDDRKHNGI